MGKNIKAIIFDLGYTIMHPSEHDFSWSLTQKQCIVSAFTYLTKEQLLKPEDRLEFIRLFERDYEKWKQGTDFENVEVIPLSCRMQDILYKLTGNTEKINIDKTLDEFYLPFALAQEPYQDANFTLAHLKNRGYKIGLISNTPWEAPSSGSLANLKRHNLLHLFDYLIFSSDCEFRKPHKSIFYKGLEALKVSADEAVFVGDSLILDVIGSQQAGMKAVWLERKPTSTNEISPDYKIKELKDLLEIFGIV